MVSLLLQILLGATLSSDSSANTDKLHTGTEFVLAFSENIAYFHPFPPQNRIQITAIKDAEITIKAKDHKDIVENLKAGEFKEYPVSADLELTRDAFNTEKVLTVTSTDLIAVHALSVRCSSVQLALVLPVENLGTAYQVPYVPNITGITDLSSMAVTERRPFKLVLVSDEQTKVTIEGQDEFEIKSKRVTEVLVTEEIQGRPLTSEKPVSVYFSHPCGFRDGCVCSMLQTLLLPLKDPIASFLVSPPLTGSTADQTFLLTGDTFISPYQLQTPLLDTDGAAVLYRPGFLLSLMPMTDWASCFMINSITNMRNQMVIMVHDDDKDGVRNGDAAPDGATWQELDGADYVWAAVNVLPERNLVWHKSSEMMVYFLGDSDTSSFANPATIISRVPDFRGCVLVPEGFALGDVADSWAASIQFCRDLDMDLISFSRSEEVPHIYSLITAAKNGSEDDVWIGLRRRSQSGEYYWLDHEPVSETNWASDEPGDMSEGQCTIMSLSSLKWRDEECCVAARPVCYRRPKLFV